MSGCADIYNLYRQLVNVCQQVDILPHEHYDIANVLISKFVKMMEAVNHKDCPPDDASGKKCLWPNYRGRFICDGCGQQVHGIYHGSCYHGP